MGDVWLKVTFKKPIKLQKRKKIVITTYFWEGISQFSNRNWRQIQKCTYKAWFSYVHNFMHFLMKTDNRNHSTPFRVTLSPFNWDLTVIAKKLIYMKIFFQFCAFPIFSMVQKGHRHMVIWTDIHFVKPCLRAHI